MTSTAWTAAASTDLLGKGAVGVLGAGVGWAGPAALPGSTGLSIAGGTPGAVATDPAGFEASGAAPVVHRRRASLATAERSSAPVHLPQNHDTTLGIPSPGSPLS